MNMSISYRRRLAITGKAVMGRTGVQIRTGHNRTKLNILVGKILFTCQNRIESNQIQLLSKRSQIKAQPGEILDPQSNVITNYREQKDSASPVGWG